MYIYTFSCTAVSVRRGSHAPPPRAARSLQKFLANSWVFFCFSVGPGRACRFRRHINKHSYIYIYIYRERERCIHIYIYIYIVLPVSGIHCTFIFITLYKILGVPAAEGVRVREAPELGGQPLHVGPRIR